jgi:protein-disulfide isomerase
VAPRKATPPAPKKGDKSFIALLAVVLVLGAGIIGYVAMRRPSVTSIAIDPNAPLPEAKGHTMGSESAPVEIVMFGDFECPGCGRWTNITEPDVKERLVKTGQARFVYMDFPLPGHPSTNDAHLAASCAEPQGKFWEMHDRIFANQHEWSQMANGRDMNAPRIFKRYARELGLNTGAFNTCFDSREFDPQIRANYNYGVALGVNSTPTFRIGDRLLPGLLPYDVVKAIVDSLSGAQAAAAAGGGAGR